ncbi:MAG: hypothetical protein ACOYT4_02485 [Nanoarchaeota archaeon]
MSRELNKILKRPNSGNLSSYVEKNYLISYQQNLFLHSRGLIIKYLYPELFHSHLNFIKEKFWELSENQNNVYPIILSKSKLKLESPIEKEDKAYSHFFQCIPHYFEKPVSEDCPLQRSEPHLLLEGGYLAEALFIKGSDNFITADHYLIEYIESCGNGNFYLNLDEQNPHISFADRFDKCLIAVLMPLALDAGKMKVRELKLSKMGCILNFIRRIKDERSESEKKIDIKFLDRTGLEINNQ